MDGAAAATSFWVIVQILFLDLLLSGDNALVIALACRRLPAAQARRAAWIGAAGAIGLRLILTLMAGALMTLPFLQLLSALPLLVIALNLMNDEDHDEADLAGGEGAQTSMLAAASVIIISDAAMSLDNVVALAAVSGGAFWLLIFGLAVSVPLIVFGSFGFARLMQAFPWIVDVGGAMLGWIAGGMIAGDPLLSGWVKSQAPALDLMLPLACAIFVLLQGRFARENAAREAVAKPKPKTMPMPKPVPLPRPRPAPPISAARAPVEAAPQVVANPPASVEMRARREVAEPPRVVAEASATLDESGDRWMIIGLIALFVVFGLFLTIFVMIPD